jgi:hypothetical protein
MLLVVRHLALPQQVRFEVALALLGDTPFFLGPLALPLFGRLPLPRLVGFKLALALLGRTSFFLSPPALPLFGRLPLPLQILVDGPLAFFFGAPFFLCALLLPIVLSPHNGGRWHHAEPGDQSGRQNEGTNNIGHDGSPY